MLKKGDMVSVTYRAGRDSYGESVLKTLENATVEDYSGGILTVSYRVQTAEGIELVSRCFDVNSPEYVGVLRKK